MAYTEDLDDYGPNRCAICPKTVRGYTGRVPHYFCTDCYAAHSAAIVAAEPWVVYVIGQEKNRRKRRTSAYRAQRVPSFVNLDAVSALSCAPIYAPKQ